MWSILQVKQSCGSHKNDISHPISSITIFAENRIKSIHIGVNHNCHGVDLFPAFVYEDEETETELLFMMYNKSPATISCSAESCIYGDVVLAGFYQAIWSIILY